MSYAELQVTTHYSFLRGASHPEELFTAAANLELGALGIVDRNSVAGMVRCWLASKATKVRLLPGCRLDLSSGESLLVYPQDRAAWSRLTRLLSSSRPQEKVQGKWLGKSECVISWEDVAAHSQGMIAALVSDCSNEEAAATLGCLHDVFGNRAYCALSYRRRPGDMARIDALQSLARRSGVTPLATGDVLFHSPDRRMLQDVVAAIRHTCTIDDLGFRRERHADRHMKSAGEMERLFASWPHMLAASEEIVSRCNFDLSQLRYQYPTEASPGTCPQALLEAKVRQGGSRYFPEGLPKPYEEKLTHELKLIERYGFAPYFLTVHSIVRFAREERKILCQGRGSAANSLVCYLLGITSIDPVQSKLLFERFLSDARNEPPDIDVDFEHDRREEVIQWIYEHYGRDRAALTAVVSRYRTRGAVRDVGKALGLSEDVLGALSSQIWGWSNDGMQQRHVEELNLDTADPRLALTLELSRQLIGAPRHLSQHPGGFVLTRDRLDDLVPIVPATMEDRRIIEWEKDDIAALEFMKVDVLGLGMLGCMRRAFELLLEHKGTSMDLAAPALQKDDKPTFEMIQKADTVGVFQIESRAQMSMLPRLKPKEFYDLVIQVAIVRPGPIQGNMVHPYLKRREGKEQPEYPNPELQEVLEKTLGVPLFQEQAMNVAIIGAGFAPAEADALRRSMATFKAKGLVSDFGHKMIEGMVDRGYTRDFAERTFRQIEGFGHYGFPESHAASFAKIAYASAWMKRHHPDIFCAALLNAQPMGFYQPAQLVRDAREHDVEVRPVCINRSRWDCTLEGTGEGLLPLRLGFRMIRGLSNSQAAQIVASRGDEPFSGIEDVWLRSGVQRPALEKIAEGDGFSGFGLTRRQALWQVRGLGDAPLPLFAAASAREEHREPAVALSAMTEGQEVFEDYRTFQLSLRDHPLRFLRGELACRGIIRCGDLAHVKDGAKVKVAGLVLIRQRPGKGNVTFITLEDESGVANAILWQRKFEAQRRIVMSASMIVVCGTVQREGQVIHVVTDYLEDHTSLLRSVAQGGLHHRYGPGDGATHGGVDPRDHLRQKARNFH